MFVKTFLKAAWRLLQYYLWILAFATKFKSRFTYSTNNEVEYASSGGKLYYDWKYSYEYKPSVNITHILLT